MESISIFLVELYFFCIAKDMDKATEYLNEQGYIFLLNTRSISLLYI